jgi:hypothetical protein
LFLDFRSEWTRYFVQRALLKIRYNLAMSKAQKALLIFLALLITFAGWSRAQKVSDDDFEGFEDDLLVLTQLSEQITLNQLSLKSFRCQEKIVVVETDRKTQQQQRRESSHLLTVSRRPDQRVNEKLIFSETRVPALDIGDLPQMPMLDQPFTGTWMETFYFENRLANDFRKLPAEHVDGRGCAVFAFETVPQISEIKVLLLGKPVPLRQRGQIWVDTKDFQLVRLIAKQLKLPKPCRDYDYRVDFKQQRLFGRNISMPARTEVKIELKDKGLTVVQDYSNFEVL